VQAPRVTSPALVSCIFLNTFFHASRKSWPLPLIPSRPFSWDEAIVRAAADIKPAVTGNDMNCTRKPDRKLKLRKTFLLYWAINLLQWWVWYYRPSVNLKKSVLLMSYKVRSECNKNTHRNSRVESTQRSGTYFACVFCIYFFDYKMAWICYFSFLYIITKWICISSLKKIWEIYRMLNTFVYFRCSNVFMVTPCINNIQRFNFQLMHTTLKKCGVSKHFKIGKTAPTCFGLQGNHHQGATIST